MLIKKKKTNDNGSIAFFVCFPILIVASLLITGIVSHNSLPRHNNQQVTVQRIAPVYQAKYDAVRVNSDQLLKQKYITTGQLKMLVKQANDLAEKHPTQENNLAVRHLSEELSNKYVVNMDNSHLYTIFPKTVDYTHAGRSSKKMTYKLISAHEKADKNWLAKHEKDAD